MSNQNIAQNNEQILNDIQALQDMERQLLNNLESSTTTLTPQQQEQIIEKINQISNMRINLYQTLSGTNQYFQGALSSSIGTLQQQAVAIDIIEVELNNSKQRLDLLENEKLNKIRLVEINDYYGDKYADHAQFMKIVIFTLIPIIIISVLHNKSILPDTPYYILLVLISIVGAFYMWRSFSSIIMRDNMNYQAYNWTFNPKTAPSGSTTTTSSASDPWAAPINIGTCVGQECCSAGQTWDTSMNQCTGTSTVTEPFVTEAFVMEPFVTETMIQRSFSKKQPNKHKSDYKIGNNYNAPQSSSFIHR